LNKNSKKKARKNRASQKMESQRVRDSHKAWHKLTPDQKQAEMKQAAYWRNLYHAKN